MRNTFIRLIHEEIAHQQATGNGYIIAMMNALDDILLINELYRASQAGVRIDLVIRGHCRLRPGIPGISENIRVISILGRFLEHSRIYYFHKSNDPAILIGSADWMRRNLDDRVEVITHIEDPDIKSRIIWILKSALSDRQSAWLLGKDGRYSLFASEGAQTAFQDVLMESILERRPE